MAYHHTQINDLKKRSVVAYRRNNLKLSSTLRTAARLLDLHHGTSILNLNYYEDLRDFVEMFAGPLEDPHPVKDMRGIRCQSSASPRILTPPVPDESNVYRISQAPSSRSS